MANRDLTNSQFRQVTEQVVENPNQMLQAGASVAEGILRQRQEAKLTQGVSQAQLELSKLDNQYRIDYEHDPMAGMEKYKAQRDKVYSQIGKDISPLYGRDWLARTTEISTRNDAIMQAWALKQSRINTVDSVNDTMTNNFKQASNDGQTFGLSDESEIEAFVNFGTSLQNLNEYASKNLGQETAEGLLETYEQDYLKSFISGVAETNPHKALKIMDDERVSDAFVDNDQMFKFKNSLVARAKRFDAANKQRDGALKLASANSLMNAVGQMGYADLQKAFTQFGDDMPEAKAFYEEVNGYSSQKKRLSDEEKEDGKAKFYNFMSKIIGKESLNNNDLKLLQESVYAGMRKDVLSKKEGYGFLNDLISPVVESQAERANQFDTGDWKPWTDNLGLDTLNSEIAKIVAVDRMAKIKTGENVGDIKDPQQNYIAKKGENLMFGVYLETLEQEAAAKGKTLGTLNDLSYRDRVNIYNKSVDTAKKTFLSTLYPELSEKINNGEVNTVVNPVKNTGIDFNADISKMSKSELDAYEASLDAGL